MCTMSEEYVYLSCTEGFRAVIKAIPPHFKVDEISNFTGNEEKKTGASPKNEDIKRKFDENPPVEPKRVKCDDGVGSNSMTQTGSTTSDACSRKQLFQCDVSWCSSRLRDILSAEAHSRLVSFARDALKTVESAALIKTKDSVILGMFPSKVDRTALHRCARYVFPHLKTLTESRAAVVSVQICLNYKKFYDIIGTDKADEIFRFILVESAENIRHELTVEGEFLKDTRRKLHHLVMASFGKFMETRTLSVSNNGQSQISIRRKPHLIKKPQQPSKDTNITGFTLVKKNLETYAAIQRLASHLRLPHSSFNFAGIKDKRAVTSQKCTVFGITPDCLEKHCQSLPKSLQITNVHPVCRSIRLGELEGNKFEIRLTGVCLQGATAAVDESRLNSVIDSAISSVKETGFVNYFGPQRFGRRVVKIESGSDVDDRFIPQFEASAVGFAMLQGDFKHAIEILLSPTQPKLAIDTDAERAKRHFCNTGDVKATLDMMPGQKLREICVLRALHRYGTDDRYAYVKALLNLPHNSRLLYIHSFCSWIWNNVATARLLRYGFKAVPGDLIADDSINNAQIKSSVRVVTEDDIKSGLVGLKDVVLTVPGNQVQYPPNMHDEYCKIFRQLSARSTGTEKELSFRIPDLKLNAPGTYRRLVQFPRNLSHKFLPPFKLSTPVDLGTPTPNVGEKTDATTVEQASCFGKSATSRTNDVELTFDLPPSCYATTFLQELTKVNPPR